MGQRIRRTCLLCRLLHDQQVQGHQRGVPGVRARRRWTAPFWTRRGDQWFWHAMAGTIPLPLDWPVYVTYEQALAYARWVGKTLPTEAQFHRAAYGTPSGEERLYPWGDEPPDERRGNFDFRHWDPIPVTATPLGDSAFG